MDAVISRGGTQKLALEADCSKADGFCQLMGGKKGKVSSNPTSMHFLTSLQPQTTLVESNGANIMQQIARLTIMSLLLPKVLKPDELAIDSNQPLNSQRNPTARSHSHHFATSVFCNSAVTTGFSNYAILDYYQLDHPYATLAVCPISTPEWPNPCNPNPDNPRVHRWIIGPPRPTWLLAGSLWHPLWHNYIDSLCRQLLLPAGHH